MVARICTRSAKTSSKQAKPLQKAMYTTRRQPRKFETMRRPFRLRTFRNRVPQRKSTTAKTVALPKTHNRTAQCTAQAYRVTARQRNPRKPTRKQRRNDCFANSTRQGFCTAPHLQSVRKVHTSTRQSFAICADEHEKEIRQIGFAQSLPWYNVCASLKIKNFL